MNILNLFSISVNRIKKKTALHPDFNHLTEFAMNIQGQDYYQFRNIGDMPGERYMKCNKIMSDVDFKMSSEDLQEFVTMMKDAINDGRITDLMEIINVLEYCIELYIDTDQYYRLFSCVLFTPTEDLTDYDQDLGDKKINIFKTEKLPDFFLSQPLKRWMPQIDISSQDMVTFSKMTNVKRELVHSLKQRMTKKSKISA